MTNTAAKNTASPHPHSEVQLAQPKDEGEKSKRSLDDSEQKLTEVAQSVGGILRGDAIIGCGHVKGAGWRGEGGRGRRGVGGVRKAPPGPMTPLGDGGDGLALLHHRRRRCCCCWHGSLARRPGLCGLHGAVRVECVQERRL